MSNHKDKPREEMQTTIPSFTSENLDQLREEFNRLYQTGFIIKTKSEVAKTAGISGAHLSNFLKGKRGLSPDVYQTLYQVMYKIQEEIFPNSQKVVAYDMPNGATYVGIPDKNSLLWATAFPTSDLLRRSELETRPLTAIVNELYSKRLANKVTWNYPNFPY